MSIPPTGLKTYTAYVFVAQIAEASMQQSQDMYRDHDFGKLLQLANTQCLQDPNAAKGLDQSSAV